MGLAIYRQDSKGQDIEIFVFDATINYSHSLTNTITDHPIEDGNKISDHIVNENIVVNFEGIVSDAAFNQTFVGPSAPSQITVDSEGRVTAIRSELALGEGRAAIARKKLFSMYRNREAFKVVLDSEIFPVMTFQSLEFPRDSENYNSTRVIGSLREINVVSRTFTDKKLSNIRLEEQDSASPKDDQGSQQLKSVSETVLQQSLEFMVDQSISTVAGSLIGL